MAINIDLVFEDIGELGPQQLKYCLILAFFNVYGAWHMLQYTFVGYDMPFECHLSNGEVHASTCPGTDSSRCSRVVFPGLEQESTIVSDWNLICDQSYKGPSTMSLFMAGVMMGAFIMGSISDHVGRKRTLFCCSVSMVIVNTLSALTGNFTLYTLLKCMDGLFCGGYILCSFVLCNELTGASKRGLIGNVIQACFAIGIVLYSVVASMVTHWRSLTLVTSVFGLPIIGLTLVLPESPRWLQSKNKMREAILVLKDIAKKNGKTLNERLISDDKGNADSPRKEGQRDNLCQLCQRFVLLQLTLIQVYSWFVNSATYYGLTLAASKSSTEPGGNRYVETALSGAVELPAYVITTFLLTVRGRRFTLCAFMITGGSALIAVYLIAALHPLIKVVALVAKLCISASFAVIYIHSSEIFPTTIRNSAMGIVSVAARAGGILAPFLAQLSDYADNFDLIVFGLLTLSAGLLNLNLPETKGCPLPDTIPDLLESLSSKTKSAVTPSTKGYKKLATKEDV